MRSFLIILVSIILFCSLEEALSEEAPKIVRKGDFYFLVRPDGMEGELVKASTCGFPNKFIFIPELKIILFSKCNGLAFESYGSDLFMCSYDGSNWRFLKKSKGDLGTAITLNYNGKNFVVIQYSMAEDMPFVEILDLQTKQFFGHLSFNEREEIEKLEGKPCFKVKPSERIFCGDTFIYLSQSAIVPESLVVNYMGNEIYITNKEGPLLSLNELLEIILSYFGTSDYSNKIIKKQIADDFQKKYIGCCFSTAIFSSDKQFFVFATYASGEFNWLGIFRYKDEKVIYLDCVYHGDHNNVSWSPDGQFLAFIRTVLNRDIEIVILKKVGKDNFGYFDIVPFSRGASLTELKWENKNTLSYYVSIGKEPRTRKYLNLLEK